MFKLAQWRGDTLDDPRHLQTELRIAALVLDKEKKVNMQISWTVIVQEELCKNAQLRLADSGA